MTRPLFCPYSLFFPTHRPDESLPAMFPTNILVSPCHSLDTGVIVAISLAAASQIKLLESAKSNTAHKNKHLQINIL